MNSKWTKIFLIFAVLVVWGLIIFKIISHFNNQGNGEIIDNRAINLSTNQKTDTFNLLLNYPDPFLYTLRIENNQSHSGSKSKLSSSPKVIKEPKPVLPIPVIKYFGLITNKKTQKLVAIINIAGKQYLAKQGETFNGVSVLKMFNDSILINYDQQRLWIRK
jgi:type II secretory pathway component PulC